MKKCNFNLIKKDIESIDIDIDIDIDHYWIVVPGCLPWVVKATYKKQLWFIHWKETVQIAGPFNSRDEAKRYAKQIRKQYVIKKLITE